MLKLTTNDIEVQISGITESLDELARKGARRMIAAALELEAEQYVQALRHLRDDQGHALVVHNGTSHHERTVQLGAGSIKIRPPGCTIVVPTSSLPARSCHPTRAKDMLREIMYAPDRESALEEIERFSEEYDARYPKAVETLAKDQDQLLTFFDFPAEHWIHLRTTSPIESTFSTVKARTRTTKGAGSRKAGLAMVFKLLLVAEKRWRKVNAPHLVALVKAGVKFPKGKAEMLQPEPAPDVFTSTPAIFAVEETTVHNT